MELQLEKEQEEAKPTEDKSVGFVLVDYEIDFAVDFDIGDN